MIIIPSKSRIFHHKQLRLLINDNKNNQSILKHDTKTGENKTTNHSISPKLCFHTIISFLAILLVCFVLTGCSDNLSSSAQASENVVIKDTSVPLTNPSNLVDGLVSDPNIFDQENSESNGQEELVKLGIENPILEEPTAETGAENPASTAQEETYDGSPIITPEQEQAYDIEIGENQPNNVNWCLYEDGTLVINGSNEATYNGHTNIIAQGSNLNINNNYSDEAGNQVPWKAYRSNIVSIEFAAPTSPLSMAYWFYDCDKLTQINSENLDTSSVISLHSTFYGCESLTNLNGLGSWDVSNVQLFGDRVGGFTIGYGMFTGCSKLSDITAITNWKFDNAISFSSMFASCNSLSDLNSMRNWTFPKAKDFSYMFSCCSRLADVSPLSNWTFPAANDFGLMFADCNSIVNLNGLENWDIPDGSIVHYMFQACYELKTAHLENWYVSNTMEADGMFEQCYNLQTIYCNKIWKPLTSEEMFLDCGSLSSATSDQSYQSNRVDGQMANPISGYFTHDGNVSFVRWAIYADGTLVINGNNINNYNNHGNLIYNAPENLDLYNIRSPQEIPWRDKISDISSIEFASPTSPKSMAYWFYDNKALSNFNWQNLNTSAVTNFSHVFDGCTSLTDIDLSTWNTTASQKADDIFAKCPNLKRIKVGDSFTLLKELPIGGDMNYYEGEHYYEGTMLSWTNDKMKVPQGQPGYYDSLTDGLSPNQIEGTWTPHVDESTKIEKIQYHIYDGKKLILGRQADNADYGSILSESGTIPITNVNAAEIPFQFRKTLTTVEVVSAIPTTSTAYWFYNCRNVTTITGLDKLNGPGITNAKNMFEGCNKLVQVNLPAGFGDGIVSADSKALLPEPESGEIIYNGKWSKEGTLSRNQFTPQEIQAMTGSDIAGTWYACENVNWAIYDNVHLVIGPVANDPIAAEQSGSLTQHGCIENLLTRDNVKLTVNDVPWHNFASSISTVNFTPGTAPYNMAYWFDSFVNMTSINFANLDITNVISLEHTFYNCKRIQTLDLSTWHMNRLVGNNPSGLKQTFVGCENLTTIYNQYSWKTKADVTAFGNNTKLKNSIYNISFNSTRCNSSMCNPIYGYFTFPSTQAVFTLQGVADNQIDLVMGVEKEVSITKYKCNISASSITGYDPQVVKITYDAADSTLTFTPLKAGNTTARINITTDRDVAALGNITLSIQVHKAVGSSNAPTLGEFPYLLTSNNAGLIWSDKTVYSQGQTVEIPEVMNVGQSKDIAFSSDFLEVYSVLGSSQQITNYDIDSPLDILILLDMSGSMASDVVCGGSHTDAPTRIGHSRIYQFLEAINNVIDYIMSINSGNRVCLVGYGGTAETIMPMAHYTRINNEPYLTVDQFTKYTQAPTGTFSTSGGAAYSVHANAYKDGKKYTKIVNNDYKHANNSTYTYIGYNTNLQAGIYKGFQELCDNASNYTFKSPVSDKEVTFPRQPACFIMSDGASNFALKSNNSSAATGDEWNSVPLVKFTSAYNYDSPFKKYRAESDYVGHGGDVTTLDILLTASFMKTKVINKYDALREQVNAENQDPIKFTIHTISVDTPNAKWQVPRLYTTLDPRTYFNSQGNPDWDFNKDAQDAYKLWEQWQALQPGSTMNVTIHDSDHTTATNTTIKIPFKALPANGKDGVKKEDIIKNINYNDSFTDIKSANLNSMFKQLVETLYETFVPVGNDGNVEDYKIVDGVYYSDPIGKFMEVKSVDTLFLFGNRYQIEEIKETPANIDTYFPEDAPAYDPTHITYRFFKVKLVADQPDNLQNPAYITSAANFNLSDIKIWTTTTKPENSKYLSTKASGGGYDEVFNVWLPSFSIPLSTEYVHYTGGVIDGYSTNNDTVSCNPMRIFYQVGVANRYKTPETDTGYIAKEKMMTDPGYNDYVRQNYWDGKLHFYPNYYSENTGSGTFGNAVTYFSPSVTNKYGTNGYYRTTSDSIIYKTGVVGNVKAGGAASNPLNNIADISPSATYYRYNTYFQAYDTSDPRYNPDLYEYGEMITEVVEVKGDELLLSVKDWSDLKSDKYYNITFTLPEPQTVPQNYQRTYEINSQGQVVDNTGAVVSSDDLRSKGYQITLKQKGVKTVHYDSLVKQKDLTTLIPNTSGYSYVPQLGTYTNPYNFKIAHYHGNNGILPIDWEGVVSYSIGVDKNYYQEGTKAALPIEKDAFIFELSPLDNQVIKSSNEYNGKTSNTSPLPVGESSWPITLSMDSDGHIDFPMITYGTAGLYRYKVIEKQGNISNVVYDTTERYLTVEVVRQLGELVVYARWDDEENISETGSAVFNNYRKDSIFSPQLTKSVIDNENNALNRINDYDGVFSFVLDKDPTHYTGEEPVNVPPMPANNVASNDRSGIVSWGDIAYSEPGTYYYTITEVSGDDPHIVYDDNVHRLAVVVDDDLTLHAYYDYADAKRLADTSSTQMAITNYYYELFDLPSTGTITKNIPYYIIAGAGLFALIAFIIVKIKMTTRMEKRKKIE